MRATVIIKRHFLFRVYYSVNIETNKTLIFMVDRYERNMIQALHNHNSNFGFKDIAYR